MIAGILTITAFVIFVIVLFQKIYNFRPDKLDNGEWVIWYNTTDNDIYGEPIREYWPKPN